ncbi:MAG: hypothetical protein ACM3NN_08435 [Nitrospirota bacterium]
MNKMLYLRWRAVMGKVFVVCALACLLGCGAKKGTAGDSTNSDAPGTPATAEQAAKVLDLSTFPLINGAQPPASRQVASLTYTASGDVKTGFEFIRKALVAQGWKELPNSSVTDQAASAMFGRDGFAVSVSVSPSGEGGKLYVMLQNHGNVKPGKLPVPPGVKTVYVGDPTAMYSTDAAVPATVEACRNLLVAQGWVPYGDAGDSATFKQNAILVTTYVSSAPAQGGKTMIQYSTQQMSADIPAPPNVEDLRYSDSPTELTFETKENQDAIIGFYQKALAGAGWKSTMDHMVDVDEKPTMIFRNPAKDMLTLSIPNAYGGKLYTSVRFQSAAEIAELDRKIKEMAPKIRAAAEAKAAKEAAELAEKNKVPKITVTLPADAKDVNETKDEIKFGVANGKAMAAVESLRSQFRDAGWKEKTASLEKMAGTLLLSKDDQSLTITYSDTGFMPSEVSISAFRAELETAK